MIVASNKRCASNTSIVPHRRQKRHELGYATWFDEVMSEAGLPAAFYGIVATQTTQRDCHSITTILVRHCDIITGPIGKTYVANESVVQTKFDPLQRIVHISGRRDNESSFRK